MGEAGLNPRDEIVGPDLKDVVHPSQVEADAPVDGKGVRFQAASLPEGHDGDAMLVGEAQDLHHLVAALRVDYDVGLDRGVVGENAAPMALQLVRTRDDAVSGHDGAEACEQVQPLVFLDGIGEAPEAFYLDRHLVPVLEPDLRVTGRPDARRRAGDYYVAGKEGHTLRKERD